MISAHPVDADVIADEPGSPPVPMPWEEAQRRIDEAFSCWLTTVGPASDPHPRPVLVVWVDGFLHTSSGVGTQKSKHLADRHRCALSTTTEGMDVVVEADAVRVTDPEELERVRLAYAEKHGWPVTVVDGAFDAPYGAPSAGPPPYLVFRLEPRLAYGFGTDETWAPRTTRWRF